MTDTGKVKPEADPVQLALSRILKLGAGGTFSLAGLVFGAGIWLKSSIEASVRDSTRQVVREELVPLEKRLTELETDREVERRIKAREK